MKTTMMKKMMASLAALTMSAALAAPAMYAYAEEGKGTLTINGSTGVDVEAKTFTAYKLFELTRTKSGETFTYKYTITETWYKFFADYYNTKKDLQGGMPGYLDPTVEDPKAEQTIIDWLMELGVTANVTPPANDSAEVRALAKALQEEVERKIEANEPITGTTTITDADKGNNSVTAKLDEGYYLIVDSTANLRESARSAPILTTIEEEADGIEKQPITVKANAPSVEKKIWVDNIADDENKEKPDARDAYMDANTAGYNQIVNYYIQADIPDMDRYDTYDYIITDTLSDGLTYADTFKLYVGGIEIILNNYLNDSPTGINVTYPNTSEHGGELIVDWVNLKAFINKIKGEDGYAPEKGIEVTYSVRINEEAIVGEEGNENKVKLTYSNDPSKSGSGTTDDVPDDENPKTDSKEDRVLTYLGEVEIDKVDEKSQPLTGAEFSITKDGKPVAVLVGKTKYCKIDKTTNKVVDYTDNKEIWQEWQNNDAEHEFNYGERFVYVPDEGGDTVVAEVGEDGKIVFRGLAAGTYKITETKAPDGYNGLTDTITITLTCKDKDKEGDITTQDVDGVNDQAIWSAHAQYTESQEEITVNVDKTTGACTISFTVINHKGSLFPETGGIGTTLFYVAGIAMLMGAGTLVIVKRKATER